MKNRTSPSTSNAEVIALNLLAYIAGDPDRLDRFIALTGIAPSGIGAAARDSSFLAGVMDYALADESVLTGFAESEGLRPEALAAIRRNLPGASG
jgi:hypothetical protein